MRKNRIETGAEQQAEFLKRGHLSATRAAAALTGVEFYVEHLTQAYHRWKSLCFRAVSDAALSADDVGVLNTIRMGDAPKQLSEIASLLGRTDLSNLQYALRKLLKSALVETTGAPSRRETRYRVTGEGYAITTAYAQLRAEILAPIFEASGVEAADARRVLEALMRNYEQAAHKAIATRHDQKRLHLEPTPKPSRSATRARAIQAAVRVR